MAAGAPNRRESPLETMPSLHRMLLSISVCWLLQACSSEHSTVPPDRSWAETPVVQTEGGEIYGLKTQGGAPDGPQRTVYAYLGIPFADTTGGDNRWLPRPPARPHGPGADMRHPSGPAICPPAHRG